MPEYEFKCAKGHTFTARLPMLESRQATCPDHGITSDQKVISIPTIGGLHTKPAAFEEAEAMMNEVREVDIKSEAQDTLKKLEETQAMISAYQANQPKKSSKKR